MIRVPAPFWRTSPRFVSIRPTWHCSIWTPSPIIGLLVGESIAINIDRCFLSHHRFRRRRDVSNEPCLCVFVCLRLSNWHQRTGGYVWISISYWFPDCLASTLLLLRWVFLGYSFPNGVRRWCMGLQTSSEAFASLAPFWTHLRF